MSTEQSGDFKTAFRGTFSGVLRWPQLDALWEVLRKDAGGGWYIYAIGTPPPDAPVNSEDLQRFIDEVDVLLRKEHEEDYCGVVYTDSFEEPSFIKIFDPNNLGVSCGFSDNPPLPGWVLSKIKPQELQSAAPLPGNRRRWWQRIFAK